ncbi:hypothetical protein ROZALSC1DRAFT_24957 [Rozella allomycis CSF55]|nr:hypothetical protein ROZALSC1DRAFT_24957 [Rozella allomycis CSF55]
MNRVPLGYPEPKLFDLAKISTMNDISDFGFLLYLTSIERFSKADVETIIDILKKKDQSKLCWFLTESQSWRDLVEKCSGKLFVVISSEVKIGVHWSCPHCTFINESNPETCEMCGLPKIH